MMIIGLNQMQRGGLVEMGNDHQTKIMIVNRVSRQSISLVLTGTDFYHSKPRPATILAGLASHYPGRVIFTQEMADFRLLRVIRHGTGPMPQYRECEFVPLTIAPKPKPGSITARAMAMADHGFDLLKIAAHLNTSKAIVKRLLSRIDVEWQYDDDVDPISRFELLDYIGHASSHADDLNNGYRTLAVRNAKSLSAPHNSLMGMVAAGRMDSRDRDAL